MSSVPNTEELTIRLGLESLTASVPRADGSRPGRSWSAKANLLHRLSREPLVHFLAAGVLLFAVASLIERSRNSSTDIRISSAEIQRLRDVWTRQYGRPPDASQMRNLVADYVREEIYYREALASGLGKDDSIIRRRLVEKMEFLSQEIASREPGDQELQSYFDRNREKFRIPAQVAFSHVFFSTSRRSEAERDARAALVILRKQNGHAETLGDPVMLQSEYPLQTNNEVKSLFGQEFAAGLFQLSPGEWQGPVRSTYGWHLVRILQSVPSRLPELNEVRQQVATEYKSERLQKASVAYYARLRSHYHIRIDDASLTDVGLQSSSHQQTQPVPQPDED